jgi:thiol-disulfide isomerase/thioredoxin
LTPYPTLLIFEDGSDLVDRSLGFGFKARIKNTLKRWKPDLDISNI